MPKFQIAIFAAALTLASAAPAFGDGYREVRKVYRYAPVPEVVEAPDNGKVVYSYTEVRIRYRGAPPIGHGIAYFNGPPELWRQREVAMTQSSRRISVSSTMLGEPPKPGLSQRLCAQVVLRSATSRYCRADL